MIKRQSYVADIDGLTALSTSSSEVSEGVRRDRAGGGLKAWTACAAAEATSATEAAAEASTAAAKSSTTTKASTKSTSHSAIAAPAAEAHARAAAASVSVLANLKDSALPVVPIELLDGVASIIGALENNNTRSLGTAVRSNVDVGANDGTISGYENVRLRAQHAIRLKREGDRTHTSLSEEVLEILPAYIEGKLNGVNNHSRAALELGSNKRWPRRSDDHRRQAHRRRRRRIRG